MTDDRLDEILRRLDALERRVGEHDHPHAHDHYVAPDAPAPHPDGAPFDEKRVVDLIVKLVSERVELLLTRQFGRGYGGGPGPDDPRRR